MTFSYSDPSSSAGDAVRFLIGDTDATESFLSDEEIAFLISMWAPLSSGKPYLVAAYAAESIAAKLAREVSVSSDGQNFSLSELMDKFLRLAERLRAMHKDLLAGSGDIWIGGVSPDSPDPSVPPLVFGTQMHDHIEAGQQDYGDTRRTSWDSGQWGERVP